MAENSKIEWTDHTWNGWWGCTHVHAGCTNCYAEQLAKRVGKGWGPSAPRYMTGPQVWNAPLKWNAAAEKAGVRHVVFASSMCDIFEDNDRQVCDWKKRPLFAADPGRYQIQGEINEYPYKLPPLTLADLRRDMFRLIDATPWLDWLLLTKRPENIRRMWPDPRHCKACGGTGCHASSAGFSGDSCGICKGSGDELYRDNAWLGTSISDQATADAMIPELLKCRDLSPVLFLSIEPLLASIDLGLCDAGHSAESIDDDPCYGIFADGSTNHSPPGMMLCNARKHWRWMDHRQEHCGIKWIITGCESRGKQAGRFADGYPDAARSILQQCQAAGVTAFHKQMPINGRVSHDMAEWPDDLRVREFPRVKNGDPVPVAGCAGQKLFDMGGGE